MTAWADCDDDELRDAVASREWYHTLELRPGIETPGWFDLRSLPAELPIPPALDGQRALDVGTFEGFWAFEMEGRGAEVMAIDILDPRQWDWPWGSDQEVLRAIGVRKHGGSGFDIAAELRGSSVRRLEMSVYDLDPATVGTFDFVYVGSLLLHLRDPVRALEAVRSVVRPGGRLLSVDAVDAELSLWHPRRAVAQLDGVGRPWWWKPNLAGLAKLVEVAGFRVLAGPTRLWMPPGRGQPLPRLRPWSLLRAEGRELARFHRRGDPHGYVLAEPRG